MSVEIGARLGSLEITAQLGKGGMGEVYRARDTKLKREVAVKMLPDEFCRDAARVSRFRREAELLASLNHPNIASIYDLEEVDNNAFLVLELVEGETLADRIQRGSIPIEEAVEIGKRICEALEAAHEKGVVHRDLKPANVKITPDGRVKVLDFGLAKAMGNPAPSGTLSNSPTLTVGATQAGVILGTAAYMSPEQAKGFEVDARSDTFSLGSVLFEMLTGRPAFRGDTVADVLASVVAREPDFSLLPPDLNSRLRELLERCLQKNLKRRWQAVGDLRAELELVTASPIVQPVRTIPAAPRWMLVVPWITAVLVTLALLVVGYRHFTEETRVLRLSVLLPEKATLNPGSLPAVSPDGRHIAYSVVVDGQQRLFVRDLDSPNARLLNGTEGAVFPFWSPNNRWIGFFTIGGKLNKIEAVGGPVIRLCDAVSGRGGTWNKDDVILFAPSQAAGLFRVSADGGTPVPSTVIDETSREKYHRMPWFLPDGHHFLYTAVGQDPEKTAIYVADLNAKDPSRDRRLLTRAISNAEYANGYVLFVRDRTLIAQSFDTAKAQAYGDGFHVAEQVDFYDNSSQAEFSVSETGVLAYTSAGAASNLQLTWVNRSGRMLGTVGPPGDLYAPRISPNGGAVAYWRREVRGADVWIHDLARGTDSPSTRHYCRCYGNHAWSPDSSHIAFSSNKDGQIKILMRDLNAKDEEEQQLDEGLKRPADWSNDGRYIIEETSAVSGKTGEDVWVLPLFGDKKPFPYLNTEVAETFPRLSPDGQWLAYVSNESKRDEVYVGTFPSPARKQQVSVNGGNFPLWSRDGKELYFVSGDGKMMAVEIKGESKFDPGVPKPLFDTVGLGTGDYGAYDVSKDGRFLMPLFVNQSSTAITVVVNWPAALKR
jgi:serine/threonine protein kinase